MTPLLEGTAEKPGNGSFGPTCDEARFEVRAVAAGTASLTIQASYETASGCVGQLAYFFLFARSDPIAVEIGIGTPQPTRTPTLTATSTRSLTPSPSRTSTPTQAATPTPSSPPRCHGDCNGDGKVTVDEIVFIIGVALGPFSTSPCLHADIDGNGSVTADEILLAVNTALDGCDSSDPAM